MPFYNVYGLKVYSDVEIPGTSLADGYDAPDIHISEIPYRFPHFDQDYYEALLISQARDPETGLPQTIVLEERETRALVLHYSEGVQFTISSSGYFLHYSRKPGIQLDEVVSYLMGAVFGLLLRQRGTTCLHASAIVVDGRAIAFVGPSGSGKSSLAALFAEEGYSILTDDILAIHLDDSNSVIAFPGYPRLKVWPGVADTVSARAEHKSPIGHRKSEWDKLYLVLANDRFRFESQPTPLSLIYCLTPSTNREVEISPMDCHQAMMVLLANTFANKVISKELRASEFEILGRVVDLVATRTLHLPREALVVKQQRDRIKLGV